VIKYGSSANNVYIRLLPIGGVSGTLAHRFVGTRAEGRVHAKTGTMSGVNALSGVLLMPQRPPVVFSFIVDQSPRYSFAKKSNEYYWFLNFKTFFFIVKRFSVVRMMFEQILIDLL
jgi:D-alanyl-D-alanine carboxypeptidase